MKRENISAVEKIRLARRICDYMGFEIEHHCECKAKPIWIIAWRAKDGESWTGWMFMNWDQVLFRINEDLMSLDEELDEYLENNKFFLTEDVGFDYKKYSRIRSGSLSELNLKLAAAGY